MHLVAWPYLVMTTLENGVTSDWAMSREKYMHIYHAARVKGETKEKWSCLSSVYSLCILIRVHNLITSMLTVTHNVSFCPFMSNASVCAAMTHMHTRQMSHSGLCAACTLSNICLTLAHTRTANTTHAESPMDTSAFGAWWRWPWKHNRRIGKIVCAIFRNSKNQCSQPFRMRSLPPSGKQRNIKNGKNKNTSRMNDKEERTKTNE